MNPIDKIEYLITEIASKLDCDEKELYRQYKSDPCFEFDCNTEYDLYLLSKLFDIKESIKTLAFNQKNYFDLKNALRICLREGRQLID